MKPSTYKAAIFREAGSVDVVERAYPVCGDDDVILRNLMTGVCGSDIAAYRFGGDDNMIWRDHEFGHEIVSEVVEMGRNVTGLQLGDRVFPNQGNVYRDRNRMATVGGFSEYIHVVQCEVGYSVLKIDNDIPLKTTVLLEPFVIGTRGVKGLNPGPGKTAIVFGAGIIGLSAAIMLQWYGCDKVMIVDVSDFRLDIARRFGLVTCNPSTGSLTTSALEHFGSQRGFSGQCCGADLYVDAIGKEFAIDSFSTLAKRESSLAVIGVHKEPVALDMLSLCYGNWHIHGCGSLSTEDAFVDILKMMRSARYDLTTLVSHEYRVDDLADALIMGGNADNAQKVCISYV